MPIIMEENSSSGFDTYLGSLFSQYEEKVIKKILNGQGQCLSHIIYVDYIAPTLSTRRLDTITISEFSACIAQGPSGAIRDSILYLLLDMISWGERSGLCSCGYTQLIPGGDMRGRKPIQSTT
jgi:hypothetical protein